METLRIARGDGSYHKRLATYVIKLLEALIKWVPVTNSIARRNRFNGSYFADDFKVHCEELAALSAAHAQSGRED
jgi:hypothetical protein